MMTVIVALVVGAVSFYGGIQYQKSQRNNAFNGQLGNRANMNGDSRTFGQNGARNGTTNGQNNFRAGFRPTTGEIISADSKSITVKMNDSSSRIVILSEKTEINKAQKATISDLKTGEIVMVVGSQNSDGSVTAQNIQLNPRQMNRGETQTSPQQAPQ